jgi:hypothetical protein
MGFKLDEPASPLFVNIIKTLFWLTRIFLIITVVWFLFSLFTLVVDLVRNDMIHDFIRTLFLGEKSISPFWILFPVWWFIGWCLQKLLKPWVKHANDNELCDLFQKAKDYPVIDTYLTEVSRDGRMISLKEYYYLDRMAKDQVKKKYWKLGQK